MILMKRQEDIMPVCELRHATTEDTDSVYALICELL
ncbi:aminoalkylphosphonic acid N-acetyltransferase, partial [Salmonella enterica subsp. enterica serovar Dublin]